MGLKRKICCKIKVFQKLIIIIKIMIKKTWKSKLNITVSMQAKLKLIKEKT